MEQTWTGKALSVKLDDAFIAANGDWLVSFDAKVATLTETYAAEVSSKKELEEALKAKREALKELGAGVLPLWIEAADKEGYTSGTNVPPICKALSETMLRAGMSADAFRKAVERERDRRDPSRVARREAAAATRALNKAAEAAKAAGPVVPDDQAGMAAHVTSVIAKLDLDAKLTAFSALAVELVALTGEMSFAQAATFEGTGGDVAKAGAARVAVLKVAEAKREERRAAKAAKAAKAAS